MPPQPTAQAPPQPYQQYQAQPAYQPYVPQAGAPAQPFPQTPPVTPQFQLAPQQPYAPPQQPRGLQHSPPANFPPAKRQRFDGPNQAQMRSPVQQQPPPFAPSGPSFNAGFNGGPARGGPPLGPANQRGRGGGMMGLRGGRGGAMGGMGAMGVNRGGMNNRNMRMGPSFVANGPPRGGMAPLRGQASRGNFGGNNNINNNNNNMRGRGSFNNGPGGGLRGRGAMHGVPAKPLGARDAMNASTGSLKKEENRRTLTDFKMIGFELLELGWEWGAKPIPKPAEVEEQKENEEQKDEVEHKDVTSEVEVKKEGEETSISAPTEEVAPPAADDQAKMQETHESEPATEGKEQAGAGTTGPSALPPKPQTQAFPLPPKPVFEESSSQPAEGAAPSLPTGPRADAANASGQAPIPPSRIRLYFHTPAAADEGGSFTFGSTSAGETRKGKRKKIEDDDGDDAEDGRKRPLPPHLANGYHDDRSSVAPSVAPSVAEGSEGGDWLMAAITEGASQGGSETGAPVSENGMNGDVAMRAPDDSVEGGDTAKESASTRETAPTADTSGGAATLGGSKVEERDAAAAVVGPPSAAMDMSAPPPQTPSLLQGADQPRTTDVQVPTQPNSPAVGALPTPTDPTPLVLESQMKTEGRDSEVPDVEPSQATEPPESQVIESQATEPDSPPVESQPAAAPSEVGAPHAPDGDVQMAGPTTQTAPSLKKTDAPVRTPSANRLSISYAGGTRRLIVDADIVQHLKLYRKEGRMEVLINIERNGDDVRGILVECLTEPETLYLTMQTITDMAEKDQTIPPLARLVDLPTQLTLVAYMDTERPLSEAKWARTGDVQEWLKSMFGRMFWVAAGADNGWEKRIIVMDPDPLPTIYTVLDGWAASAGVGTPPERQRFLKTHMCEMDNILEVLLRLVRGERATTHAQNGPAIPISTLSGPLLSAHNEHPAHANQQTHVSLAVIALFRMTLDYARRAVGQHAKKEVEDRMGEIIKCIPNHLVYKSLDGIFKEWKVEKRR
ncbi:hypothetical protein BD626DRAFT_481639 [Schizophyllum amplum]|uniref:Uncharacterized protein n=1 Tax=Schizophyllum amplum TaxID=97359 RepID=A0A550CUD8_9AGAR|nr:hypothetical protein BD626DRAFT_481639 [Auriculariopsis ampla]